VCLIELPDAKLSNGETKVLKQSGCLLTVVDFAVVGHFILVLGNFGELR
jgi:hypothetical protein